MTLSHKFKFKNDEKDLGSKIINNNDNLKNPMIIKKFREVDSDSILRNS